MSGYRWKRFVKSDLKMPEVPEGKIIITTDSTGHRRVLLGAANVRRYFGKNTLWVELYHDREERAIGFKPTPKKTKDAYRMHSYGLPISGIESEFGFKDGVYEVFWDKKNGLLVAKPEKAHKQDQ